MYTGPRVFNDFDLADMYYYVDTANSDCWDGTAIASDTKLYNLAQQDGSEYFYAYDSSTFTSTNYEITRNYIHRKCFHRKSSHRKYMHRKCSIESLFIEGFS